VQTDPAEFWNLLVISVVVTVALAATLIVAVMILQRRHLAVTRSLSGRILNAQEEERAYVARELHDGLLQRVALLAAEVTHLAEQEKAVGAPSGWHVGLRDELADLGEEIRRIAHRMHPAALDMLGLRAALEMLVDEFGATGDLSVTLQLPPGTSAPPSEVSLCIYRIVQEGLRNVVQHAQVREATLRVTLIRGGTLIEILDNGRGLAPTGLERRGLGLKSARERVRALGGDFSFQSAAFGGTRLVVWLPGNWR
jgi:signal transduction histidine kinase